MVIIVLLITIYMVIIVLLITIYGNHCSVDFHIIWSSVKIDNHKLLSICVQGVVNDSTKLMIPLNPVFSGITCNIAFDSFLHAI